MKVSSLFELIFISLFILLVMFPIELNILVLHWDFEAKKVKSAIKNKHDQALNIDLCNLLIKT
ncbi:hypothetical protein HNP34_001999 [Acinetobacter lwoffii]|uniref:DUF3302 domain-containing protein n=1 Tax=Acinetobacter lwoffii TaxID=28090 RepID=A0AAW3VGX2_ACILW|nr:hypothetical protein [Acinetobacter lwoffii]